MDETTWLQLIVILNIDYLTTVQDFKWSVMRFDHCPLQRRFSSRKRRSHTFDTQHETICNTITTIFGVTVMTQSRRNSKQRRTNVLTPFYIRLKKPMYSSDLRRLENNNYTDTHQKSTCTD